MSNDILSDKDLEDVTGVKAGAHGRSEKIIDVLRKAGIYHWLTYDGNVRTTWHHVHAAGQSQPEQPKSAKPNFSAANKKAA